MTKKLELSEPKYSIGEYWYLLHDKGRTNKYLGTDGRLYTAKEGLENKLIKCATKELAEQALENYNNKGREVMKTKDLKQGMIVEFKEGFLGIMLNDSTAVTYAHGGYSKGMMGEELAKGSYPIQAIYEVISSRSLQADLSFWLRDKKILEDCNLLWKHDDPFKDLKRVFEEGASIIIAGVKYQKGEFRSLRWDYDIDRYKIKDNISIEQWDKHKEVIKEFWNGAEIECFSLHDDTGWYNTRGQSLWTTCLKYRVKPKVEETVMTIREIEAKHGYTNLNIKGE